MHNQPRTSLTHPLQIAEVQSPTGGSIGITFCPGKCAPSLFGPAWQRDLAVDLDAIKAWGAECVVTLVEHHELESLQVARLGDEVRARGMRWLHLPIVDVNVPSAEFEAEWKTVVHDLVGALGRGGKVLVHCKGGLGRAGTVASLLLVETGEAPATAIRKVRAVRPGALETPSQERYAMNYKPHTAPAA
jgi:ADP-ribosyl-[dinitrogen reductase] hydrolase